MGRDFVRLPAVMVSCLYRDVSEIDVVMYQSFLRHKYVYEGNQIKYRYLFQL